MYQKHDREPIIKEHVSIGKKCNLQMSTAGTKITQRMPSANQSTILIVNRLIGI